MKLKMGHIKTLTLCDFAPLREINSYPVQQRRIFSLYLTTATAKRIKTDNISFGSWRDPMAVATPPGVLQLSILSRS